MMRIAAVAAVLALSALWRPVFAQSVLGPEQGPICREASVVDEMARAIRARDPYARVDPRLVTEQPGARTDRVLCQVCVLETPYDMPRFGAPPVASCHARGFEVRVLPAGYIVRDLGRP
jgi:hypothetical protein